VTRDNSPSQILQLNERIKHGAGAVTVWGNALLIASVGKWAISGLDLYVLMWFLCAVTLIWAASQSLTMMKDA
jgi:hypothetical protein